jgi:hypothetical protein
MDEAFEGRLAALLADFDDLGIRPSELRRDPTGARWLTSAWRVELEADPRLASGLRDHIAEELEMHDSFKGDVDALFTRRVLAATATETVIGAGLAPRYRAWILGSAYALALTVALSISAPWLGTLGSGALHRVVAHEVAQASDPGWWALALGAAVVSAFGVWGGGGRGSRVARQGAAT